MGKRAANPVVGFPSGEPSAAADEAGVRVDKWLWAARFFKTRSLAQTALENGRVLVDGARVKRSRALQVGVQVWLRTGIVERTVVVRALSENRGPAPVAQQLYEETAESVTRRAAQREKRSLFIDPAAAIAAGRPTKRDRRRILDLQDDSDDANDDDDDQPEPGYTVDEDGGRPPS